MMFIGLGMPGGMEWLCLLVGAAVVVAIVVAAVTLGRRPPTQGITGKLCSACGKYNVPDGRFCSYCGKELVQQQLHRGD